MIAAADWRQPARLSGLVVAPEAETRQRYGTTLSPLIPDIAYAEDGRDALVKALGDPPTVLVTEHALGFFDGETLCSLLRNDPLTAGVRLVVITRNDRHQIIHARASGADRVLTAPCKDDLLFHAVSRVLSR